MTHDDRNVQDFEERFRRWAGRPPTTSPEEAARRVADRVPPHRETPLRAWPGLAAAAVLLLGLGLWLWFGPVPSRSPQPPVFQAEMDEPVHPTDSNEVLLWLDESTPLYRTFAPPGQEGNDS